MQQKTIYQKKIINCKALDVDTTGKKVKIAIAELESKDRDGDIILPTAVDRTIAERGPLGTNEIWHLLDHTSTSFSALSKFIELGREGKYVAGLSPYKDSFAWREVAWPLYESGDFNQHSIGYSVVREQKREDYNEIQELSLWEGSAVLWGANPFTPTLVVQKSLGILAKDDLISQLERLMKAVKLGKHEDESHKGLIIIEIKRIQQSILDFQGKSTEPLENDTQPNDEGKYLLNELKLLNAKMAIS
jgi:hypothetical protein